METFLDPSVASGQRQTWYPWPYVEGLTMAEATNELAFLVTGAYGKPVSKQMGAPLRLAVPWKYGFKSIKSIVRFSFTDRRPKSFWEALQGAEYGFWANVNPQVPHPRWSQATEELIGLGERRPTLLFNGYGDYVAHLYKGLERNGCTRSPSNRVRPGGLGWGCRMERSAIRVRAAEGSPRIALPPSGYEAQPQPRRAAVRISG